MSMRLAICRGGASTARNHAVPAYHPSPEMSLLSGPGSALISNAYRQLLGTMGIFGDASDIRGECAGHGLRATSLVWEAGDTG